MPDETEIVLMDKAIEINLRACARDLLDAAPGENQRERIYYAIVAIAWESGGDDKSVFDASPIFHAFSDAMSLLTERSGVKRVEVVTVNVDRTMWRYRPKAKKPTVHNLSDDQSPYPKGRA